MKPKIGQRVKFSSEIEILQNGKCIIPKELIGLEGVIADLRGSKAHLLDNRIVRVKVDIEDYARHLWNAEYGVQVLPLENSITTTISKDMPHTCPICRSPGCDLIFSFACSNNTCQNYRR